MSANTINKDEDICINNVNTDGYTRLNTSNIDEDISLINVSNGEDFSVK